MANIVDINKVKTGDCYFKFIQNGGELIVGIDEGAPDGDCSARVFYKDGEYHIQSLERRGSQRPQC